MTPDIPLQVEVPGEGYHRGLICCQAACPVHTDARGYVRAIAAGRFEEAYLIARGPNPFASICGRVCGAPCEAACRRGKVPRVDADGRFVAADRPVAIRALKRFACEQAGPEARSPESVLDAVRSYVPAIAAGAEEMAALLRASVDCPSSVDAAPEGGSLVPPSLRGDAGGCSRLPFVKGEFRGVFGAHGQRIAIVGAGPAGLSAAHDLALMGFKPVVFETEPVPAGMLALGIPAYRLPRDLIAREVAVIEALGVEIRCGTTVGRDISLAQLRREFSSVVLAVGAKASRSLGLPGEQGPRVYGGVDLLRAVALHETLDIGREAVVIGGGNVAYDVARTVLRQIAFDTARTAARLPGTARVHLVSLETLEEMPADTVEIIEGDEEGIERHNGWGPLAILRDSQGAVSGVTFRRCHRVYDENRRFSPVFAEDQRLNLSCDTVLLAVGQSTRLDFLQEGGADIEQMRPGWPKVDPATLATTAPDVFVAGDLAHGTRLLIDAVASGKAAARSVYRFLTGRSIQMDALTAHWILPGYQRERGYEAVRRVPLPTIAPDERLARPAAVVERGYGQEEALREASRCLDCGVSPVFDGNRCLLCGGCVDVCPTQCLKLVALAEVVQSAGVQAAIEGTLGPDADLAENSAIVKDEDRCIRCALCAARCPADAITMERVTFSTTWRCP